MRLKYVYISQYKNLKEFTLNFDGNSFIDVFVGKNGTGKSNLFEAVIEIFRHLYEYGKTTIDFDYKIIFEIDSIETKIDWTSEQLKINGIESDKIGKKLLPDNVLIYYSGHNDTVTSLVEKYESTFRKRIKTASFKESRRFIGIGSEYKELLLSVLLMQPNNNTARKYICEKLCIQKIASELRLKLQRPFYADANAFNIENSDESDRYWKPKGITKKFLDRLSNCISPASGSLVRDEGYFKDKDRYTLYFSIGKIQHEFSDFSSQELFRQFDNLKTLNMLAEISIPLTLENGIDASIAHFSDGQFQSVYIYSIVELFKDRNCITLLDEPDSFLHPEWQFDFLKQVLEITETTAQNNHVLMSSHSAATLSPIEERTITLFKIEDSKVQTSKESKKQIIRSLSNSLIQYSEGESTLLIENVIRTSTRPILFVEGPSDVSILNTAFEKLFPDEDISVLIQDAFDRGFIKILLSRDDMFKKYPNKHLFGLFDFDRGYADWRSIDGSHIISDIQKGLCKEVNSKTAMIKAHVFLLPIPENELKKQVWDESNPIEKIKSKPCFCIEHVFWSQPGLDQYYKEETDSSGCKVIHFKGDKVKFATKIVPTLSNSYFEVFRPIFEFIRLKCPA
jgi:predicted ATP-binding protein involved in virulence